MQFSLKIEDIIPNAKRTTTEDEVKKQIQEINMKRKLMNSDWIKQALKPEKTL